MKQLVIFQTTDGTVLSAYVYKDNAEAVCYAVAKGKGKRIKNPFAPISVVDLEKQPEAPKPKAVKQDDTTEEKQEWIQLKFDL